MSQSKTLMLSLHNEPIEDLLAAKKKLQGAVELLEKGSIFICNYLSNCYPTDRLSSTTNKMLDAIQADIKRLNKAVMRVNHSGIYSSVTYYAYTRYCRYVLGKEIDSFVTTPDHPTTLYRKKVVKYFIAQINAELKKRGN